MSDESLGGEAEGGSDAEWTTGLDDDMRGFVETKGYKSPADVVKAYASLESKIGHEKVPLPPKGEDGTRDFSQWDGWSALGRPETPEYEFKAPEGKEFTDTDKALQAHMAPVLHEAGLSQWQVDKLSAAFDGFGAQLGQQSEESKQASAAEAEAALKKEWGKAFDQNLDLANRFIRENGLQEVLEKYGAGNDPALAKAFAAAARASGEDSDLPGGKEGAFKGILTPSAAQAEIDNIYGDAARNPKHPLNNADDPEHEAVNQKLLDLFALAHPEEDAA